MGLTRRGFLRRLAAVVVVPCAAAKVAAPVRWRLDPPGTVAATVTWERFAKAAMANKHRGAMAARQCGKSTLQTAQIDAYMRQASGTYRSLSDFQSHAVRPVGPDEFS